MTFDVVINLLCEIHCTHGAKFILVPHQFEVPYNHGREKKREKKGEGERVTCLSYDVADFFALASQVIDGDGRERGGDRGRENIERGG